MHTLIHISTAGNLASLSCTPNTSYVCDGAEVICSCVATCDKVIQWRDDRTVTFCSRTQYYDDSGPECLPPVCMEVIARNNCTSSSSSGNFTSRLHFNSSLEMESIHIGCYIIPEAPDSNLTNTTNESCGPPIQLSSLEQYSATMWRVTNCTGIYMQLEQVHSNKNNWPNIRKSGDCSSVQCGLVSPLVLQLYIFPVQHSWSIKYVSFRKGIDL